MFTLPVRHKPRAHDEISALVCLNFGAKLSAKLSERLRVWGPLLIGAALLAGCGGGSGGGAAADASSDAGSGGSAGASADVNSRKNALTTMPPAGTPPAAHSGGAWGPVFDWPLIPIHSVLMPDGRVMTYGSRPDGSSTAYFNLDLWDNEGNPDSGHLSIANGTGVDIFCGSQLLLPPLTHTSTPTVFMAGGDAWNGITSTFIGIQGTTVFNAASNSLNAGLNMNQPRWYSTSITLTNGETYIQGGFGATATPEVRQLDGSFRQLTTANTGYLVWSYPRNYVMPDGRVFGYDYEGRMYFVDPSGTGALSARSILPWQYFGDGSSAMFRPGRILQVGANSNATAVIDVTGGEPVFLPTQSVSTVRKLMTATLLADGQVLVTGGSPAWNELPGANRNAEIWNPTTGQWTLGATADRARLYHSTALLLPDASVLVGGGGAPAPIGGNLLGERNVEIYYPPYLFKADGSRATRPIITAIPDWLEIGKTFALKTDASAGISRVTLVKTGAATHGWNFDQRFIELSFNATSTAQGQTLAVNSPARAGEAPPGYYMVFVFDSFGAPSAAKILRMGVAGTGNPGLAPTLDNPGKLAGTPGVALSVALSATDPNGDALRYSAAGLPKGLVINPSTGLISGTPEAAGEFNTVLSVSDGTYSHGAQGVWSIKPSTALTLTLTPTPGASLVDSNAAFAGGATGQGAVQYSWSFGDGSPDSAWSSQAHINKNYSQPGTYAVTLKVRDSSGTVISRTFLQSVYLGTGSKRPTASTSVMVEVPIHGRDRLWVVNADNDSVTGFDTLTNEKLGEINVGASPRSIALASSRLLWVSSKGSATISVIDPERRNIVQTLSLPRASQPHGLAVSPTAAQAFVVLEATGQLLRFDTNTYAQTGSLNLGPNVRHVSVSGNGQRVYVTRFITPPLQGESGLLLSTPADRGAEVLEVDAAAMSLTRTIVLAHSDLPDAEAQGSGVPNYLGPFTMSPDNSQGHVPGKQDNIKRGSGRSGSALNFQNTVRAVSARIPLTGAGANAEDRNRRIDHDNASLASAVAYDNRGVLMFVALETSREVAVIDAHSGAQVMRFDVGLAPQGLTLSTDGFTLYVHNFMDRSVSVHDLRPLLNEGLASVPTLRTLAAVASERLSAQVLRGKQLFYDARDTRLARDRYMSCATCHNDGGHDGRSWDMSQMGEGVRNTISLRGHAGAQGRLHWSGNFDEVQDFEGQIRSLAGGTGLLSDSAFLAGSRSQPLGDPKAGLSADLDALAAYVASLNSAPASPWRDSSGALTAQATQGRDVFARSCAGCHGGSDFSSSGSAVLHDIGTTTAASGQRLGQSLNGLDSPTLRDAWATAPYLHNGSAATLQAAIQAHARINLTATELAQVLSYTQQIDGNEAQAPSSSANLVVRALATLAGRIGALFEVRVNSAVVGSGQLDAGGWVDLFFDVAALVKNTVIEIVFKNDQNIGGEDRNLAVQSIRVNNSAVVAGNDAGTVLDAGSGAQAFDGLNLTPAATTGGWMPWNAAMRLQSPDTPGGGGGASTVTVRGRATLAAGVGAQVELWINGTRVGSQLLNATILQDLQFNTPALQSGDRIDVVFSNDAFIGGQDRNLFVQGVTAGTVSLDPIAPGVTIDRGAGAQAFDGLDVVPARLIGGWVPWNGALRLTMP